MNAVENPRAKKLRKPIHQKIRAALENPPANRIQVICAAYGVGKTELVMRMVDAEKFPVLLGFYTRQLRDESYQRFLEKFPKKSAIKLDSPMEQITTRFGMNEGEFYAYLQNHVGGYFEKTLKAYLEQQALLTDDDIEQVVSPTTDCKRILTAYRQASRRFKRLLNAFFDGEHDAVFITQQGLILRALHSESFSIPDHVNVVFDELEVALWAEGEDRPQDGNGRASRMVAAGGRWSILTGDSRPTRAARMPDPFSVVDCMKKQWIEPITFRTNMPLGLGDSVRVFRGRKYRKSRRRFEQIAAKKNHHNREVALPLILAEEKARAKRDGKKAIFVGNVNQDRFGDLGIRSFESMKGANWIWESETSYRIVILGPCPPPEVLRQNSVLFGSMEHTDFVSWGKDKNGVQLPKETITSLRAEIEELLEGDLLDKVAQVVARVRGFRSRPDCDVVVYLWNRQDSRYLRGKLPYVWLDEPGATPSLVERMYHSGRQLKSGTAELGDELRELKIVKRAMRVNMQHQKVVAGLRRNLGLVCDDLRARYPKFWRYHQPEQPETELLLDE